MFQSLADSFETQDNWIGDNLKNGRLLVVYQKERFQGIIGNI